MVGGPLIIRTLADSEVSHSFARLAATQLDETFVLEQWALPPKEVVMASGQIESILNCIKEVLVAAYKAFQTTVFLERLYS